MTVYRCMSTMYPDSGIQEDAVVNTFHVETLALTPDFTKVRDAWSVFMNKVRPVISSNVRQNDHTLKMYNLASPEPRAPVYEATWNFTSNPTGAPLPPEVALCVSFEGVRISGQDQRRRRGRIYLGPFSEESNDGGVPGGTLAGDIAQDFVEMIQELNVASWFFIVWSRANEAQVLVGKVWADNAWDTQRRRGIPATSRTTYGITQPVP